MRTTFTHDRRRHSIYTRRDHGTWYFKIDNQPLSLQTADQAEALQRARLRLTQRAQGKDKYAAFLAQTDTRGQTIGKILDLWIAAGYPEPNLGPRTKEQQDRQAAILKHTREYWDPIPVATIKGPTLTRYAAHRRATITSRHSKIPHSAFPVPRSGTPDGGRTIDLDLTTLSNALNWAVAQGHCEKNPFHGRSTFQNPGKVVHCTSHMPASDEELHRLCAALLTSPNPFAQVSGAQLMFQALTGLRPGEPSFLRLHAAYAADRPEPGLIYTRTLDGHAQDYLAVRRLKHGINPAVKVHSALRAFLDNWLPVVRHHWPASPFYFPNPDAPSKPIHPDIVAKTLRHTARALRLPHRRPHAMRAFYVRVRRAQGLDDGAIALELGERTGAPIIVAVYGAAHDTHGDARFDWLPSPESGQPTAWTLLPQLSNTVTSIPATAASA